MRESKGDLMGRGTAAAMLLVTVAAVRLALAASASVAPAVVGDWQGALSTGSTSLRVVVHLSHDKDGKLSGTMDSPDQGATGIVMSSVSFAKPDLHLAIEAIGAAFDGKFDGGKQEIAGVWKQGAASLPLTLSRLRK